MDSIRWERMQQLFHEAADRSAAEQRAFLETACAGDGALLRDVLAMLAEDARAESVLDRDIHSVAAEVVGHSEEAALDPEQFQPYRLQALLGEGGMGTVYLAERSDLGSRVAIKVLRDTWLSPGSRKRFAVEQRTLAQLNHPGIARLYDAHTLADGTPWFVMEYVDGLPLTEYCTKNRTSLEARIKLFRAVCEAVQYAHQHGVIHRDLKPSNILVKADGSVRLLDFGIAKRIDTIDPPHEQTRTGARLLTPAYAAPEQIRGEPAGMHTDIYSLGVILYQLLSGRLPYDVSSLTVVEAALALSRQPVKPSVAARQVPLDTGARVPGLSTAIWADLDVLCLTCMHADAQRRYVSIAALIRDLDHFLRKEPLEARPDTLGYSFGKFVHRRWRTVVAAVAAFVVIGGSAALLGSALRPGAPLAASPGVTTVAVLPFQSAIADSSLAVLQSALADEIATALSYTRYLAVRAFATTSGYTDVSVDPYKVGQQLGVARLVTGRLLRQGGALRIALAAIDVPGARVIWSDTVAPDGANLIDIREAVAAKAQGTLAIALGAPASTLQTATPPRSEEAYALYLRTAGVPYEPGPNKAAIALLERAVALDSTYVPAIIALSRRYYVDGRYETGNPAVFDKALALSERAVALDSNFITARARLLGGRIERGELVRAYQEISELVRRRPDSPDAHFFLSYVFRFAGLLPEAARECEAAVSLDAHNFGWRSCAVVSLGLNDYPGALGYIRLDPGGPFANALTVHTLIRQGKEQDAIRLGKPGMPAWKSYDLLLACAEHKPAREISRLAAAVTPDDDPESNYFAAAHLSYCGQTRAALRILRKAIDGNYCSYPALDSDPYFARVRGLPEYADVRAAGVACQQRFLRGRTQ